MKKIKGYVDAMVESGKDNKAEFEKYFTQYNFEDFLSMKAERYFKNEQILSLFTNIQSSIDDISKEELIKNLETIKKGYEKTRLTNNPINFSTNPITNMVRLWHFEVYAELIKHIDIMLNRYL